MNINNFMQNLAYIWQPQKLEKGFLSANNKSLGETLTIQDPATGKKINLAEQKTDKKNPWLVGKVDISKSAELLAKADKAMAEVFTQVLNKDRRNIPTDFKFLLSAANGNLTLETGLKLYEFTSTNADIAKLNQPNKKGGFSIYNAAKNNANVNTSQAATGSFAIFEKVVYDYSYTTDIFNKEPQNIDMKRQVGGTFVAKKLEIKNNVLDLSGIEYVYNDIPNSKTKLPYGVYNVKDLGIFKILENAALTEDEKKMWTQTSKFINNFLRESGIKPGEFTFINSKGEVEKLMITKDLHLVPLESFHHMQDFLGAKDNIDTRDFDALFEQRSAEGTLIKWYREHPKYDMTQ